MDWPIIIMGAAGAFIGAFAGSVVRVLSPRTDEGKRPRFTDVLTLVLIVIGSSVGPNLLDPHWGPYLRESSGDDIALRVDELFTSEPFFVAMETADPGEAAHMRTAIRDAYLNGGSTEATRTAQELGRQLAEHALATYGRRATDQALYRFFEATRDWGRNMQSQPANCYTVFYGQLASTPPSTSEIVDAVDGADHGPVLGAITEIVRTAGPIPVVYDAVRAAQVQVEIGTQILEIHAPEDLRFMLGAVPQNQDEMQLACDSMLAMFDLMLAHEDGVLLLRLSAESF